MIPQFVSLERLMAGRPLGVTTILLEAAVLPSQGFISLFIYLFIFIYFYLLNYLFIYLFIYFSLGKKRSMVGL